jgi:hypothetical protein
VTIREQVLQALELKVGAMRGVDSYDESALPVTALFEGADEPARIQYGMVESAMPVRLERVAAGPGTELQDGRLVTTGEVDKSEWWTEANQMLGELIQSATGGDNTLGGLCQGIDYVSGGAQSSPDGSNAIVAFVDLRVRYRFLNGNPYAKEVE